MSNIIPLRCEARDTGPYCCDGRCVQGRRCPQEDACPIRSAADDAEAGRPSPLQRARLTGRLRRGLLDPRGQGTLGALHRRDANSLLRWRLFVAAVIGCGLGLLIVWVTR
ncbi:MAG: hypothetical protein KIH64_015035 [Mycobacterium sp.]|nr:hypothetical protein [Mycobacterium sp.]